jgi:hypothetical protein
LKNLFSKLFFTVLSSFYISAAFGQQSPTSAGGDATGSGGSAAYSIGQVLYNTQTGSNGTIIEGVQQPFEISVVLGDNQIGIDLEMAVYPNPTADFLILHCANSFKEGMYRVTDINGNTIQSGKTSDTHTTIQLNNTLAGTYLLNVIEKGQNIKIFKFIKN